MVENKPGANGIVGVLAVKAAAADGYTLMLATTSTNAAISACSRIGLRPGEAFRWWGHRLERRVPRRAGRQPLQDAHRLRLRQGQSGKLNFGYFNASSQCGPSFGKRAASTQAVAYKAIGNAWTDLYAGAIQFMFVDLTAGRGQVVANKARRWR